MKLKFGIIFTLVFVISLPIQVFAELQLNTGKVINGRTMIPLRGAFEQLGFKVSWDKDTNSATLQDELHTITMKKGDKKFVVDGETYKSDVSPQLINGTLYIPLRSIADKIGAETSWDAENEFAKIIYDDARTFVYARTTNLDSSSRMGTRDTLELLLDTLDEARAVYRIYGEAMVNMESDPDEAKELLLKVKQMSNMLEATNLSLISSDAEESLTKYTSNLSKAADECIKYLDGRRLGESAEVLQNYYLNSNEYSHYAVVGLEEVNTIFENYWNKVKTQ